MKQPIDMSKPYKITRFSKPVSSHNTLDEALDEITFRSLEDGASGWVLDQPLDFGEES